MNLIVLLHTQPDGSLPKAAFEAVSAAKQLNAPFSVGILGANAKAACGQLADSGAAAYYAAEGDDLAQPRYATDVAAAVALVKAAGADHLEFGRDYLIPKPMDPRLPKKIAKVVAQAAIDSGVAQLPMPDHYME